MSAPGASEEVFSVPATPPTNELASIATLAPAAVEVESFATAAAHLQMFEKLRDIALRMTRPTDWHLFGDKPWPMRGAAEKIMRGLGLNVTIHRENGSPYSKRLAQDELGGYYIITVSGEIAGQWGKLEAMGFCSSRDQFFAADGKDSNGNQQYKPLSMVKEEHLIQAAYTNFIANAVMRYTGISGFTMADLEKHYGTGQVSQHAYRENKTKTTTQEVAADSDAAKRVWAILTVVSEGDEPTARELLKKYTAFKFTDKNTKEEKQVPGVTDVGKLSAGRLKTTAKIIDEQWKKWLEAKPEEERGFFTDLLNTKLNGGSDAEGRSGNGGAAGSDGAPAAD